MNEDRLTNHEPPENQRLIEAMEACRADDDLGDPSFSDLAERLAADPQLEVRLKNLQRVDARIKLAFQDVPVPQGVAERVLAQLGTDVPRPLAPSVPSPAPRRISRRALLVAAGAMSVAAVLLVAVVLHLRSPRPETPFSIVEGAVQFFDSDADQHGALLADSPAPADYPLSRDLRRLRGIRWRWVEGFVGDVAVAYDLPGPGGIRATLYVARRSVAGLSPFPPTVPSYSTAGKSAGAWQVGDTLYVLVVEGDTRAYRDYLNDSSGPLT